MRRFFEMTEETYREQGYMGFLLGWLGQELSGTNAVFRRKKAAFPRSPSGWRPAWTRRDSLMSCRAKSMAAHGQCSRQLLGGRRVAQPLAPGSRAAAGDARFLLPIGRC